MPGAGSPERAHAPVAEGVDAVSYQPSEHHFVDRVPVCHYPIDQRARARAHRTGFSRSGRMRSSVRFAASGEKSRSLDWVLRLVYLTGTVYVRSDARSIVCVGPVGTSRATGPLHVRWT